MRVKIVQDRRIAGYGLVNVGDEREFPDGLAKQLLRQGVAIDNTTSVKTEEPKPTAPTLTQVLSATEAGSKPKRRRI